MKSVVLNVSLLLAISAAIPELSNGAVSVDQINQGVEEFRNHDQVRAFVGSRTLKPGKVEVTSRTQVSANGEVQDVIEIRSFEFQWFDL